MLLQLLLFFFSFTGMNWFSSAESMVMHPSESATRNCLSVTHSAAVSSASVHADTCQDLSFSLYTHTRSDTLRVRRPRVLTAPTGVP